MEQPKAKIAITIRPDLVDQIREHVKTGDFRSVSAYIEHAVLGQLAAEAQFDELLAESMTATGGRASRSERAAARRLLSA